MPLGLNINNPQEENPIASTPIGAGNAFTFGGNALGSGASTSTTGGAAGTTTPTFSTILLYGAIGLAAVFILQRLEK